jgi:hypothetical protein
MAATAAITHGLRHSGFSSFGCSSVNGALISLDKRRSSSPFTAFAQSSRVIDTNPTRGQITVPT